MSSRTRTLFRGVVALALAGLSGVAVAQIQANTTPANPSGVFQAFPAQNPMGPTGMANVSINYPYPGQCLASAANASWFPLGLPSCGASSSFAPFQRTASSWADQTGAVKPFKALNLVVPGGQEKFRWPVLNPIDYTPDTATFPGADYYEIGLHEAWGFQSIASAGLFPDPTFAPTNGPVPNGMQWTGITCDNAAGCTCPADASASFIATYCTYTGGTIPPGAPLFTPIWGVGQINMGGGPIAGVLGRPSGTGTAWSANNYHATWPSISIRGVKDRPVVVKWVNEFPNTHVLCPHPDAADWPCAIDRTFMGVKATVDPALPHALGTPPNKVNRYGSPQQPDNSWVTHLHGGEIPPSTDGFAEKWYGNAVTALAYTNYNMAPPFENPLDLVLTRPTGNFDTYTYPMVNEEALIWFHDHTLGKTHHNVIAGPAGFFPVLEPKKHAGVGTGAGTCPAAALGACTDSEYTWLDPVTQPRDGLGVPMYDLFLAIQDRSFNDDGSIHFSENLGLAVAGGDPALPNGFTNVTAGVNPEVHPVWVPEYFGDHALVNGVIWPRIEVADGHYRIRMVDGSDSRCWNIGFSTVLPAPGAAPTYNIPFSVIANDQGYLGTTWRTGQFVMCPGERYEILINFAGRAGTSVYMVNNAGSPFPLGETPMQNPAWADMNVIMRFDVVAGTAAKPAVKFCTPGKVNNWNATWVDQGATGQAAMLAAINTGAACIPLTYPTLPPATFSRIAPTIPVGALTLTLPATQPNGEPTVVRQVYLNEKLDGFTGAPLGMQLNGVPFEYKVTETPKINTREFWQFINLTVDTHPMHPHLVRHQVVARQNFNVARYKAEVCGSAACQPGPAPGNEMQVVPDVTPFLYGSVAPPNGSEMGWKDAVRAPPNQVTTIVADWHARWNSTGSPNAPGTPGCPRGQTGCIAPYVYEDVTSGPYVWHCHINSHEDSEMMRTSLVVPPTLPH